MKNLATVVYYTANMEKELFEQKIRDILWKNKGDLPLISVSHKPINFGTNICVGEHEPCNSTLLYQVLTGAKAAKTPFIISSNDDFLYPPEYFTFKPPSETQVYRYNHIRILYKHHHGFLRKQWSEGAQIVGRKYLISILEKALKNIPKWSNLKEYRKLDPYRGMSIKMYRTLNDNACVSFKTGDGMRKATGVMREKSVSKLSYWGSAKKIRKEMFGE